MCLHRGVELGLRQGLGRGGEQEVGGAGIELGLVLELRPGLAWGLRLG